MQKIPLRKLLLNLHMYAGLLCFCYLIIFGISSLNFNHPYEFTKTPGTPSTTHEPIALTTLPAVPATAPINEQNAVKSKNNDQVRQALNLVGFNSPWRSGFKDPTTYHATIIRPGKTYDIDVHLDSQSADITAKPDNLFVDLKSLHGLGGQIPGSIFINTWGWYTELCTFTVIFAALSGIYLWTRRKNERRLGLLMLSSGLALSLALILYITFHG